MKIVAELIVAVVLFFSTAYVGPKIILKFKKEVIQKIDHGLSPLSPLTKKFTL